MSCAKCGSDREECGICPDCTSDMENLRSKCFDSLANIPASDFDNIRPYIINLEAEIASLKTHISQNDIDIIEWVLAHYSNEMMDGSEAESVYQEYIERTGNRQLRPNEPEAPNWKSPADEVDKDRKVIRTLTHEETMEVNRRLDRIAEAASGRPEPKGLYDDNLEVKS